MGKSSKQYWLLKTEPGEWSWEDQKANQGVSNWDGVKNKQAQKYLKAMKTGDLCFFYHSGTKARRVVGVVEVIKEWYDLEDKDVRANLVSEGAGPTKEGEGAVDVKEVGEMRRCVDLKEMKGDDGLKGFMMFKQSRLSVMPVEEKIWNRICELGDGFEGDGRKDGDCDNEDDDSGGDEQ